MKIAATYSHLNGYEWLRFRKQHLWDEIESVVESIDASKLKTKVSKEKTMKGKMLYSPAEINVEFKRILGANDWHESRFRYWVTDDHALIRSTMEMDADAQKTAIQQCGKTPILSYNQTDFVKQRVAL